MHPGYSPVFEGAAGRLYDLTEGQILLDGRDIREYDLQDLYHSFGIIFQDFGKYAVSVEDNIRFGDVHKNANMAAVRQAAKESSVTADQITVLENGRLVEMGNHAQLMALQGKYHKLFTTQAKRYLPQDEA